MRISDWSSDVCSSDLKIDMRDGNADQWLVIGLDDSEAGAWCFFLQTQARKQAPRQRRFACPPPAPQGNDVARLPHFGKPRAKGPHHIFLPDGHSRATPLGPAVHFSGSPNTPTVPP